MPQFIETQFPIARLSAEAYKERKANNGQTLTRLGKWWGRKPLILVRASIVGMLMPASDDAKKDREIFLKILTMDDEGAWQRCKGDIPVIEWRRAASPEMQEEHFTARGFKRGTTDEKKEAICAQIWDALTIEEQQHLDALKKRAIDDRQEFDALPYAERITHCDRPENVEGPSRETWTEINQHLGTSASSLAELVEQLGGRLFGHRPIVGDSFCGGGSIPFEAARIGCDAFGSDLNPVAGLLTWASLHILGGGSAVQSEVTKVQSLALKLAAKQIDEWGIECSESGERADAFLYCVEVKPDGCDYYIPLAPSWLIGEKSKTVVTWELEVGCEHLVPKVRTVDHIEMLEFKNKKGATVVDGRIIDPFDSNRSWSFEAIRGHEGLRRWKSNEIRGQDTDVFVERLYCIRWTSSSTAPDGKSIVLSRYAAPNDEDLKREKRVVSLLQDNFHEWQEQGYIPSRPIPTDGEKTEEPIRTRGWTQWHQLFTPRQLLTHGAIASAAASHTHCKETIVAVLLGLGRMANWDSRLCRWRPDPAGEGVLDVFSNQALNAFYNFGNRGFTKLDTAWFVKHLPSIPDLSSHTVKVLDARDITETCDLWITDPPYADAINYHELGDFFLAWYDKQLAKAFPEWTPDSRAELAVRGDGEDFRRSMVDVYRNLAKQMPDNGMQMVMFTHQDPGVWADLGMILWAAGLKATAAWTISTETEAAGIKKGNYVQGTVCLVLRKRVSSEPGFLDEIYPMVEDEVRRQIDSMQALDEGDEPNFNDADYQLAAYAAALKVLTQYGNIDGRDVEHEVFAVRGKKEKSDFQIVIERALGIACDYLVPKGLDEHWRDLTLAERYYLRALDIESRGERRKGMYEELARGFGVTDIRPLLKSDKANGAQMHTPSGFAGALMSLADGGDASADTLPTRRGRSSSSAPHPFATSPLRHLLFAIRETAAADNSPEPGRQYLRDTFGQSYWAMRERFVSLLEWLAALGNAAGMEEWHTDSKAARFLLGRLRNDHA